MKAKIPVGVFLFRRPERTRELLQSLALVEPPRIHLFADGPRDTRPGEAQLCDEVRRIAETGITWKCEVKKHYSSMNRGLRQSMEGGLDLLFKDEEFAVVLEDDCVPKPEFFTFCLEIDRKYRSADRLGSVSGSCFLPRAIPLADSFYFSRYSHCWGWATWADRWREYRRKGWSWPAQGYRFFFPRAENEECRYWNRVFRRIQDSKIQSWAYGWQAFLWQNELLCACPSENLVTNMGFGPGGTNTKDGKISPGAERLEEFKFPLNVPAEIQGNSALDSLTFKNHFLRMSGRRGLWQKIVDRWNKLWQCRMAQRKNVEL